MRGIGWSSVFDVVAKESLRGDEERGGKGWCTMNETMSWYE
jgi:hypothetical protein